MQNDLVLLCHHWFKRHLVHLLDRVVRFCRYIFHSMPYCCIFSLAAPRCDGARMGTCGAPAVKPVPR